MVSGQTSAKRSAGVNSPANPSGGAPFGPLGSSPEGTDVRRMTRVGRRERSICPLYLIRRVARIGS